MNTHIVHSYDEELKYAQDYELWLRLSRRRRLASLPEVLYHYRASMQRRHEEQAAVAARVMLGHWQQLSEPDESARGTIARCIAGATWGGRGARQMCRLEAPRPAPYENRVFLLWPRPGGAQEKTVDRITVAP